MQNPSSSQLFPLLRTSSTRAWPDAYVRDVAEVLRISARSHMALRAGVGAVLRDRESVRAILRSLEVPALLVLEALVEGSGALYDLDVLALLRQRRGVDAMDGRAAILSVAACGLLSAHGGSDRGGALVLSLTTRSAGHVAELVRGLSLPARPPSAALVARPSVVEARPSVPARIDEGGAEAWLRRYVPTGEWVSLEAFARALGRDLVDDMARAVGHSHRPACGSLSHLLGRVRQRMDTVTSAERCVVAGVTWMRHTGRAGRPCHALPLPFTCEASPDLREAFERWSATRQLQRAG